MHDKERPSASSLLTGWERGSSCRPDLIPLLLAPSAERSPALGRLKSRDCSLWSSMPSQRHSSLNRASEVFSQHLFQRDNIEHLLRQHLLERCILGFQSLQAPRVRHLHVAIFRTPLVEDRVADPMLAVSSVGEQANPKSRTLQGSRSICRAPREGHSGPFAAPNAKGGERSVAAFARPQRAFFESPRSYNHRL